jgi:Spy/CpxP family protein refolding chaperone
MMTRTLLVAAAMCGAASSLLAQDPRPTRPMRMERMRAEPGVLPLDRLKARLNLSDDQVTKLKALQSTHAAKPSREPDRLRAQADLMQAMQGTGDLAAARKAMERMNAVRTDAMMARLEQRQQLLAILTPEQRAQVNAMGRGMRGGRGMRMGMGGGRGMGGEGMVAPRGFRNGPPMGFPLGAGSRRRSPGETQ